MACPFLSQSDAMNSFFQLQFLGGLRDVVICHQCCVSEVKTGNFCDLLCHSELLLLMRSAISGANNLVIDYHF